MTHDSPRRLLGLQTVADDTTAPVPEAALSLASQGVSRETLLAFFTVNPRERLWLTRLGADSGKVRAVAEVTIAEALAKAEATSTTATSPSTSPAELPPRERRPA